VRRELVIPLELPSLRVERQHRAGVKVVTGAAVAVEVVAGIARLPVDGVEVWIVGAGEPCD
jgi:hypothetical protein